jgi:high-affinity iron transporter
MGLWFSIFPNVQTIVAQVLAAILVVGSYFLAEEMRVRRPRRRGAQAGGTAGAPPPVPASASARRSSGPALVRRMQARH